MTAADLPHSARGDRADIVVVVVESGLTTDVKRGENHGKVLTHAPVVRYLATIGQIAADESRAAAVADIPLAPTGSAIPRRSSRSCRNAWPRDPGVCIGGVKNPRP